MNQKEPYTLQLLLESCIKQERSSQKELYRQFFAYGLNICLHYSKNKEEAQEILNDSFLKVFQKLKQYNSNASFKAWLRRILINTAIDHYRKYHKQDKELEVVHLQPNTVENEAISKMGLDELLALIQKLPPSYRIVFNLYVMEGFTHPEIARKLDISVGTSKSNLSKARAKLQGMIGKVYPEKYKTN